MAFSAAFFEETSCQSDVYRGAVVSASRSSCEGVLIFELRFEKTHEGDLKRCTVS